MKKNKMMRIASILMVAVLVSTCAVSGTFAKYVTSDSGSDTARVAKFGVVVLAKGSLFGDAYNDGTQTKANEVVAYSTDIAKLSVKASSPNTNVVAPGTKSSEGLALSVTGIPEVRTKIDLTTPADKADTDIVLKNGKYGVMAKVDKIPTDFTGYFTLESGTWTAATAAKVGSEGYKLKDVTADMAADYLPIKWNDGTTDYANVAALKAGLLTGGTKTVNPLVDLSTADGFGAAKTVTWEWKFEDGVDAAAKAATDSWDTILGDMIYKAVETTDTRYEIVKIDGTTYTTVKFAQVAAAADKTNQAYVAYTGDTLPTAATAADVAVLTVSLFADLTVTQVD